VNSTYQEVRNIENFQGIMMNFSNMDKYKASILPPLDDKMGAVSQYQDVGDDHDKRFSGVEISSIENSKLTMNQSERPILAVVKESVVVAQHRMICLQRSRSC
jgi:hypothetical protein